MRQQWALRPGAARAADWNSAQTKVRLERNEQRGLFADRGALVAQQGSDEQHSPRPFAHRDARREMSLGPRGLRLLGLRGRTRSWSSLRRRRRKLARTSRSLGDMGRGLRRSRRTRSRRGRENGRLNRRSIDDRVFGEVVVGIEDLLRLGGPLKLMGRFGEHRLNSRELSRTIRAALLTRSTRRSLYPAGGFRRRPTLLLDSSRFECNDDVVIILRDRWWYESFTHETGRSVPESASGSNRTRSFLVPVCARGRCALELPMDAELECASQQCGTCYHL